MTKQRKEIPTNKPQGKLWIILCTFRLCEGLFDYTFCCISFAKSEFYNKKDRIMSLAILPFLYSAIGVAFSRKETTLFFTIVLILIKFKIDLF
jgi:hypothetical protein